MATLFANTATYKTAFAALQSGDTLVLAPGNYGVLYMKDKTYTENVTIKGGSFTGVQLTNVSHVTLDGSTIKLTPTLTSTNNAQAVRVVVSDHVTITNAKITGGVAINGVPQTSTVLDKTGNVIGLPAGKGVNFETSSDCTISNSDISVFHKGVTFSDSTNITITDNTIHDLRTSPITGSVLSGLTITGNHTWTSHPWSFGGAGDHGDRIHVWVDHGPVPGVTIANNLLEQGSGDGMVGIYLDDNGMGYGFPGAVVSGNTVVEGTGQGILLENVSGTVTGNTLVWSGTGTAANDTPRFQIDDNSHNIVFTDNVGHVHVINSTHDLQFWNQTGTIEIDPTMTRADRMTITENATVVTPLASYTLDAVTDNLTYSGIGNFTGVGNDKVNHLTGWDGNDVLDGKGGADILEGLGGDDTYYVDNAGDKIIDTGGNETIYSSISWTLGHQLETLIYTGTVGAVLNGNDEDNTIVGGIGNDVINGNLGNDTLIGGLGDDTYYINNPTQTIIEAGGNDTVIVDRSYVLATGLENLTLTGSTDGNLTGNAAANILIGNSGANIIDGKAGADTMVGGDGNDFYYVDNAGDVVVELDTGIALGGLDKVKTTLSSYTLGTGVEDVAYGGSGSFTGIGNALVNTMTGSSGVDKLYGMGGNDFLLGAAGNDVLDGGAGADKLTGGTGNDEFLFHKGEANGDIISDFVGNGSAAGDTIHLIGWAAGSTMTLVSGNVWAVTDSVDHSVENISITGAVHVTDILFG
ncbi:right-handed parallel beta-helix repeat-containing protein [Polymorphobacter arshaanensis]|nr:right-handed parallel beta-helix repeat-containing protein [Polymorphobacter arshaanensis]